MKNLHFVKSFFVIAAGFFLATSVNAQITDEELAKHPEFMWEGSNRILQCRNCQDKTCQMKKKITAQLPGFLHPYHKYPKVRRRPENVKD